MRKSLIALSIVAATVSTAAFAANMTDTSAIKMLDKTSHQITLADGKTFVAPKGWNFDGRKVGDKVRVTYSRENGKMVASTITASS